MAADPPKTFLSFQTDTDQKPRDHRFENTPKSF